MLRHDTGPYHPERPERLIAVNRALRQAGMLVSPDPFPDLQIDFGPLPRGRPLVELPAAQADEKWLQLVHRPEYIERVRHVCSHRGVLDQGDTPGMEHSFDAALWALGCVLQCCDAVMTGKVKRAFAAVRPPGHHAEPQFPMGFCLFSNIAIAARYLQTHYGMQRIAIVDFDVHHGNGTQAAFADDPDMLYVSTHQSPLYPGTGGVEERGVGNVFNAPLPPHAGSLEFRSAFAERLLPAIEAFRPGLVLISAGFDAHRRDPLANLNLDENDFAWVTAELSRLAQRHCEGRLVSTLEGGYDLTALARSAAAHVRELMAA